MNDTQRGSWLQLTISSLILPVRIYFHLLRDIKFLLAIELKNEYNFRLPEKSRLQHFLDFSFYFSFYLFLKLMQINLKFSSRFFASCRFIYIILSVDSCTTSFFLVRLINSFKINVIWKLNLIKLNLIFLNLQNFRKVLTPMIWLSLTLEIWINSFIFSKFMSCNYHSNNSVKAFLWIAMYRKMR